jgi:glutamate synthase (ferredoxin)
MKVKEGLYLPEFEHDNCGAGFICNLNGIKSNDIIHKALDILITRTSGAVSADGELEMEQEYYLISLMIFLKKYVILKSQNKQYAVGMVFMPKVPTKSFFAKPL